MATKITIDPVTRIEGHLKIEVTVDSVGGLQKIVDARASGTLFRGFETVLAGRDPHDAPHITSRICGVCPTSHAVVATEALDAALGADPPDNARLLRNLVLGADFIHSHILHFYHLAVLDYVAGPGMAPWQPAPTSDLRFDAATTAALVEHYGRALEARRQAHEMGAVFGGRLPMTPAFTAGGFTAAPTVDAIARFRKLLEAVTDFVRNVYLPDVAALAARYPDYLQMGSGPGNLLAFGVFDEDAQGTTKLLRRGLLYRGSSAVRPVDPALVKEDVRNSWYSGADGVNPAQGTTVPAYPKNAAYSWIKAPRYQGDVFEVGPLARMKVNGDYTGNVSVVDRHWARADETLKIAEACRVWLDQLVPSGSAFRQPPRRTTGTGIGLGEAPRGALAHWMSFRENRLSRYQVVTPTCWNASPRDASGQPGAIEQALIGTPVQDVAEPIEALRIVHSFDPCLACAVHVLRPGGTPVAVLNGAW
ncbi:MAG: nickel-dependent hydrogenase large subunit [Vicinamibacterales bacterium]